MLRIPNKVGNELGYPVLAYVECLLRKLRANFWIIPASGF